VVQVGDLLREFRGRLTENGIESARHEAALLISSRCGLTLAQIYSHPERPIGEVQAGLLRDDLERRLRHEPMAYILGAVDFYGLTFTVGPGVLIPRADTERLVEIALDALASNFREPQTLRILDTCSGTGCVGISIAHHLRVRQRGFTMTLVEKDPTAAAYTHENVRRHGLEALVSVIEGDLWPEATPADPAVDFPVAHTNPLVFDLITANPPYIVRAVIPTLMPDVAKFEPQLALDGGADGLDLYHRIIMEAPSHLSRPGLLLVEHGFDQAVAVDDLLSQAAFVDRLQVYDYGSHPRVTGGWLR
jgi:release factor glutamine methyltransferase